MKNTFNDTRFNNVPRNPVAGLSGPAKNKPAYITRRFLTISLAPWKLAQSSLTSIVGLVTGSESKTKNSGYSLEAIIEAGTAVPYGSRAGYF
jgi:hypothetical protein